MHFVAVKTEAQQAQGMLFRTRDLLVRQRTQTINALRGHLAEYGVVAPQGRAWIRQLAAVLEDEACGLPEVVVELGWLLLGRIDELDEKIDGLYRKIQSSARELEETARPILSRGKLLGFLAAHPKCTVVMEACAGAHYWARKIVALGHDVRLVPPIYVKPFVKRCKNDAANVEAITEAAQRPTMHFVAVKTDAQPARPIWIRSADLRTGQQPRTRRAAPTGRIDDSI